MGRVLLKYMGDYYTEKVKADGIVALENVATGNTLIVSSDVYINDFRAVLVNVELKEEFLVGEVME